MKIFVDGGIRSGVDILKALALGADADMIGRPFVTAVYGGAADGVNALVEKLSSEDFQMQWRCAESIHLRRSQEIW